MSNIKESGESTNNDSGAIPNNSNIIVKKETNHNSISVQTVQSQPLNIRPRYPRFHPPFKNHPKYNTYSYTPHNIPYTNHHFLMSYPQYPNTYPNTHPNTYSNTYSDTYPNIHFKP